VEAVIDDLHHEVGINEPRQARQATHIHEHDPIEGWGYCTVNIQFHPSEDISSLCIRLACENRHGQPTHRGKHLSIGDGTGRPRAIRSRSPATARWAYRVQRRRPGTPRLGLEPDP